MAGKMIQNASTAIQSKKAPETIQEYIVSMKSGIAAALPSVMTPERFTRIALSAVSSNTKLQQCNPGSFLAAMMNAAQLGLEPNTPLGQAYLIPYGNQCQFIVGYKGLLDLAWRSGEVLDVQAEVVCVNDIWEYELGLNPKLRHVPAESDRGDPVRYYAVIRTKDGGSVSAVMSKADVISHAQKYSKSYSSGPWKTNFDEMAKKTLLRRVLKYAPLKSDFITRALTEDGTVKAQIAADMAEIPNIIDVDESTGEVIESA
jgi:recombination protein RecT